MDLSRRGFLGAGAALSVPLALGFGTPVAASLGLGRFRIDTLSDGHLVLPGSFLLGPDPSEEVLTILQGHGLSADEFRPECNLTLVRDEGRTVLFDAGSGPDFAQTAGLLAEAFEANDLGPEDVTDVVFTHAHPDHLWGVLDDFGDLTFPNATYHIGRQEWDYWIAPETVDTIGEARASFAVGARRRLLEIEDQVVQFDAGDEIFPGIAAIASYGHTPGHMAFELRDGSDSLLIVGDAIGNHHMAFEAPHIPSGSDQDADPAIVARKMLLDRAASEQMQLIGFHLPGGGFGRCERAGDAYRFVPEAI